MSIFKKKGKIQGNIYDLNDEEVQQKLLPSMEDLESNLFSEMEEEDMKILELQNSLIERYKNTPVVKDLKIN